MRRIGIVAALLALVVIGVPSSASATKTCRLDEATGLLYCVLVATPAPDRSVPVGDTPIRWVRLAWTVQEDISRGLGCVRIVGNTTEIGQAYFVFLENSLTGERLLTRTVCVMPGDPPPQPPTDPPTLGELALAADEVLTLQPSLNPAPEFGGITGLDTWLWCTDPGTVEIVVDLRGWTADAAVQTVDLDWTIAGVENSELGSRGCGSETEPGGTWQPQAAGDHTVTLAATWAGTWDLTYQGTPMGTFTLGPLTVTSPADDYPVDEFVGVLLPNGRGT